MDSVQAQALGKPDFVFEGALTDRLFDKQNGTNLLEHSVSSPSTKKLSPKMIVFPELPLLPGSMRLELLDPSPMLSFFKVPSTLANLKSTPMVTNSSSSTLTTLPNSASVLPMVMTSKSIL